MYAFYMSLRKPAGSQTENTFSIWRIRNHNIGINLNGNKLENVQRDTMNKKILKDIELREIKEKVIADVKDRDSGNVGIRDEDVDDRYEVIGSTSYTDADTSKMYADQRQNVNHTRSLDDIPIDERSGDEFELVREGNHNVSYDATGNNIIMSHPSVNEKSKTNSNPKNERLIKLKKKTMMLSVFCLETKLLRLPKKLKLLV